LLTEILTPIPTRPEQVEVKLEKRVPQPFRLGAHHWLILHGRYACKARTPECWRCPVVDLCSYSKKALRSPRGVNQLSLSDRFRTSNKFSQAQDRAM
jgi:adenine-specific DNA glycosylase